MSGNEEGRAQSLVKDLWGTAIAPFCSIPKPSCWEMLAVKVADVAFVLATAANKGQVQSIEDSSRGSMVFVSPRLAALERTI